MVTAEKAKERGPVTMGPLLFAYKRPAASPYACAPAGGFASVYLNCECPARFNS